MKFTAFFFAFTLWVRLACVALESNFAASNEGWTTIDHTSSTNPQPALEIRSSDPNPAVSGGRLVVQDIGNNWNWIVAPAKFRQSWTAFTDLKIDLVTDVSPTVFNLRFFIAGGVNSAWYEFPLAGTPGNSVLNLSAPLQASAWNVTGNWQELITNVTAFYVRIDLNNNVAAEADYVDRIALVDGTAPPAPTFPVKFLTEQGSQYQVESSPDLQEWRKVGNPVPGNGLEITVNVLQTDAPRRFFRARKLGTP